MCHAIDIHGISFLFYLDFSFVLFGFNSYCLIQIPNGLLCSYIGILLFLDLKFLWSWIFGSVSALWDDVIKLTRSWKLVEFYSYGLIDSNSGKKKTMPLLNWLMTVFSMGFSLAGSFTGTSTILMNLVSTQIQHSKSKPSYFCIRTSLRKRAPRVTRTRLA